MTTTRLFAACSALMFATAAARAETTVEWKGTHMCRGACVRAVNDALKAID